MVSDSLNPYEIDEEESLDYTFITKDGIKYHASFYSVETMFQQSLFIRVPQALGIVSPSLRHCLPTAWALPPQALGIVCPILLFGKLLYEL